MASGKTALFAKDRDHGKSVKHLLISLAITIVVTGCSLPAERNVHAYVSCMLRHPQEGALCDGPRKAYEVDTSIYQPRATDHPAAADPVLLRLNPTPVTPGPNG